MSSSIDDSVRCSFCDTNRENVLRKLFASPKMAGVSICDECIDVCNEILAEEYPEQPGDDATGIFDQLPLPSPAEIKSELDEYVIGQDQAIWTRSN